MKRRGFAKRRLLFEPLEPRQLMNGDPAVDGQWTPLFSTEIVAVHTHLLPTGDVLMWPGDPSEEGLDRDFEEPRLWNPSTNAIRTLPPIPWNSFCSGHAFLPDGRLLVAGGHAEGHVGLPNAGVYDPFAPDAQAWTQLPDMNDGRWYPTNTALANGDILVVSGEITRANVNSIPQVWETENNRWRSLTNADFAMHLYPFMFQAPNGLVVNAGPNLDTRYLDPRGPGAWQPSFATMSEFHSDGSAVMYDEGRILVVGGAEGRNPPTANAEMIDLNAVEPAWTSAGSMSEGRKYHNATLLPDGTVLITGGTSTGGFNKADDAVLEAELWNPTTGVWETLAAMDKSRLYHSVALLLPDGRVLVAGGGQPGAVEDGQHLPDNRDAQIFSPPYLFQDDGTRAVQARIEAPSRVGFGETFRVNVVSGATADDVAAFSLVRLGSVTHAFNQNQRFDRLVLGQDFVRAGDGFEVLAPRDPNLMPPGHYLLFAIDVHGTPSVADIVQIGVPSVAQLPALPTKVGQTFPIDDWDNKVTLTDLGHNYFGGNAGATDRPSNITTLRLSPESHGSVGGSLDAEFAFPDLPLPPNATPEQIAARNQEREQHFSGTFFSLLGLTDTLSSFDGSGQKPSAPTAFPGFAINTQNLFGDFGPWQGRSVERLEFDTRLLTPDPLKVKIELKDEDGRTVFTRRTLVPSDWQTVSLSLPGDFLGRTPTDFDWRRVSMAALIIERFHAGDGIENPDTGRFLIDNLRLVDADGTYPNLAAIESSVAPVLDRRYEDRFLDYLRSLGSLYFLDFAAKDPRAGGIIQDRSTFADLLTVGGVGFQLTSYVIDAEQRYLTREQAAQRTRDVLKTLWEQPQGPGRVGMIGHEGFFYHFLGIDGLRKQNFDYPETTTNEARNTVELSTIDTALAIAGVVTARQFFSGTTPLEAEIRQLADQIYGRVNWRFMLNDDPGPDPNRNQRNQFFLGWKPNENYEGASFEIPDARGQGRYSGSPGRPQTLDYYTDESLLIALLAMGSPNPQHRLGREVWDAILRVTQGDGYVKTYPGALFTYQFLDLWADTAVLGADNHPTQPTDFHDNSRRAIETMIDYVAANPLGRTTFDSASSTTAGTVHWGLNAAEGVFDEYFADGAPPTALGSPRVEQIEAESGVGFTHTRPRGNASRETTARLNLEGQRLEVPVTIYAGGPFGLTLGYANDRDPAGADDRLLILVDGIEVGEVTAGNTRPSGAPAGSGWNEFVETVPLAVTLGNGRHVIEIRTLAVDQPGVEIDYVQLTPAGGGRGFEDGTATNYGLAASVPFVPLAATAALWENVQHADLNLDGAGDLLHPRFGLADAYNFNIRDAANNQRVACGASRILRCDGSWISHTGFAIDHGPALIALDNHLTNGFVPRLFMNYPPVRMALQELFPESQFAAGVIVDAAAGELSVSEDGLADYYRMRLATRPVANVTIDVLPGGQLTATPASVTFTPNNWDVPQTVRVSAANDAFVEGVHRATLTHRLSSADGAYHGLAAPEVVARITDDDGALRVLRVPQQFARIQDAIDAAQPGDTVFVAAGTYRENLVLTKPGVSLRGAGADRVTVDGQRLGPVLTIRSVDRSTVVAGFHFTNGLGGAQGAPTGGGLEIRSASPVIAQNWITQNQGAYLGNGMAVRDPGSQPLIVGNVIRENSSSRVSGGYGGGAYFGGGAGGVFAENRVERNNAWYSGGGLQIEFASPIVVGNTIVENTADASPGIVVGGDSAPTIHNNVIARNSWGTHGGAAVFVSSSSPSEVSIVNNTIADNPGAYARDSIGVYVQSGRAHVRNNVIADNRNAWTGQYSKGLCASSEAVVRADYNDIVGHALDHCSEATVGLHDLAVDPRFVNRQSGDYRLGPDSPVIDAGDPDPLYRDPNGSRNDLGAFGGPAPRTSLPTIAGRVWDDINGNGVQDGGEPGLTGAIVRLTSIADDTLGVTDASGRYTFASLVPGEYRVQISGPAGTRIGDSNRGFDDRRDSDVSPLNGRSETVTLTPRSETWTIDAGLYRPTTISGSTWFDTNADGLRATTEVGLDGVVVELFDAAGTRVATQTSRAIDLDRNGLIDSRTERGRYVFESLPPGTYSVRQTPLTGYVQNAPGPIAFGPPTTVPLATFGTDPVFGDVNGDGLLDAIVESTTAGQLTVRYGRRDGGFFGEGTIALGMPLASASATKLVAGDWDGDGDDDLAALTTRGVSIVLSRGDGTFDAAAQFTVPDVLRAIVAADLDRDGDLDLAIAASKADLLPSIEAGRVEVLLNVGRGQFVATAAFPGSGGGRLTELVAGDFDGDAQVDLVAFVDFGSALILFRNNGAGEFPEVRYLRGFSSLRTLRAADVDGNRTLDLVGTTNGNALVVFPNAGGANFGEPVLTVVGDLPSGLDLADVDADGDLDAVVAYRGAGTAGGVAVLTNVGAGTFRPDVRLFPSTKPRFVAARDLDLDGDADLLTADLTSPGLQVRTNTAGRSTPGAWRPHTVVAGSGTPVTALDFGSYRHGSWATRTGRSGTLPDDGGRTLTVDAAGNTYVAGSVYYVGDSGNLPGAADLFLAKYSPNGALLWQRQWGSTGNDRAVAIDAAPDGSIVIAGHFEGTVDFDLGAGEYLLTSTGSLDTFVAKYTADGGFVWAHRVGQTGGAWDVPADVAIDDAGHVLLTGRFGGTVDFDPSPDPSRTAFHTARGDGDMYLLKLDGQGRFVWVRAFGGSTTAWETIGAVATNEDGDVFVSGRYADTTDFDRTANTPGDTLTARGIGDMFVARFQADGDFEWVRSFGSTGGSWEVLDGLTVGPDGSVTAFGYFQGQTFDPGLGGILWRDSGWFDLFLTQLGPDGSTRWARQIGGTGNDRGRAITSDAEGNVYATGLFNQSVDFDPGAGAFWLTSRGGQTSYGGDGFVLKLTPAGNFGWVRQVGGTSEDSLEDIAWTPGGLRVTGWFSGSITVDTGTTRYSLTSAGGRDIVTFGMALSAPTPQSPAPQSLALQSSTSESSAAATDLHATALNDVVFESARHRALELTRQLGLLRPTSDQRNWGGRNEKWIPSRTGDWYFLLPDGRFYAWDGREPTRGSSLRASAVTGRLVTVLSDEFYDDLGRFFQGVSGPAVRHSDAG